MIGWGFTDILLEQNVATNYRIEILKIGSIAWLSLGFTSTNFVFAFLNKKNNWFLSYQKIVTPCFIALSLGTDWIVAGVKWQTRGWHLIQGWLQPISVLMTINIALVYIVVLLIQRLKTEKEPYFRKEILLILFSFIMTAILGTMFDVFLPKYFGIEEFVLLAFPVSAITISAIFIAMIRYKFMLLNYEEVSRKIFADLDDGVILVNNYNFIVEMNSSAEKILSLKTPFTTAVQAKGIIPMDWLDFITPKEVLLEGEPNRWLMVSKDNIRGQKTMGTFISLRDITALKMAQIKLLQNEQAYAKKLESEVAQKTEQLQKANDRLYLLNEEKNNFLSLAVHDLKAPLSNINLLAHFIEDKNMKEDKKAQEHLKFIRHSSKEMSNLITDLLDVSKIESQAVEVKLQQTNLSEISVRIVQHFQILAANRNIELHSHLIESSIIVEAEPQWTEQCIRNLLSNAIKYSPSNTKTSILLNQDESRVLLSVTDQGPGIKPEDTHKLFQQFSQLSTAQQDAAELSTGLGLYLVKEMMEKMGGRVYLDETYNEGARFVLEFQFRKY